MNKQYEKWYQVKGLLPDIYGIGTSAVMMYLIVGSKRALLVDTGYGLTDPHEVIRSITKLPFDVVNSHGHIDHAGGNFLFEDENVYMHPADLEVYLLHTSAEYRREGVNSLKSMQKILFWMKLLPPKLNIEKYCNATCNESRFRPVEEGYEFDLGTLHAKVVELPGHTAGSIGLWIPERKLIITSDAANPGTWMFLPESKSLETYRRSLNKINDLDVDSILTGHSMELFTKSHLADWMALAENLDFENGKVQKESKFAPHVEARCCRQAGNKKNKARLTISADKL